MSLLPAFRLARTWCNPWLHRRHTFGSFTVPLLLLSSSQHLACADLPPFGVRRSKAAFLSTTQQTSSVDTPCGSSTDLLHLKWTQLAIGCNDGPCTRSSHGLSLIKDVLLLYGGEHTARTPIADEASVVWTYDSTQKDGAWRAISCQGATPPCRVAHAQAVHADRYLYIFGGRAGIAMEERAMNDLWVLDTDTFIWSQVEPADGAAPEARSFHRMVCIDGSLYVFGGCGDVSGRLADLHRFDIATRTWHDLGSSQFLRGRGGATLLPIANRTRLAIVAGFAGEETKDGHCYDISKGEWESESINPLLEDLRPRSVCSGGTLDSLGISIVFGGEVDPSDHGHEGAGGFENDIVVLDSSTGAFKSAIQSPPSDEKWPQERGWSDAAVYDHNGAGSVFVFGGLSGNDESPERLNDLWRLDVTK